jgi:hypothetical protein
MAGELGNALLVIAVASCAVWSGCGEDEEVELRECVVVEIQAGAGPVICAKRELGVRSDDKADCRLYGIYESSGECDCEDRGLERPCRPVYPSGEQAGVCACEIAQLSEDDLEDCLRGESVETPGWCATNTPPAEAIEPCENTPAYFRVVGDSTLDGAQAAIACGNTTPGAE